MRQDFAAHVELEAPALLFPAYLVAGLAGASFKPEHLHPSSPTASVAASSRSMQRTTWARADRRIACSRSFAANIRCRCTASACRSAVRATWIELISSDFVGLLNAMSRRLFRNISPGRRTRRPISTISCPCPTTQRPLGEYARISMKYRKRSADRSCSKILRLICLSGLDRQRNGFHPGDREAHRMRPAA